jgi:hypothetical protein
MLVLKNLGGGGGGGQTDPYDVNKKFLTNY